jgi:SRSO17 transposase
MARRSDPGEERFREYVDQLGETIGHADRREPMRAYLTGLLLPGERKSVEPMAAKIDPRRVRARHQSMHHFVSKAPWDDDAVLRVAREYALQQFERHGGVAAWVVDDTGIPKKGTHSVGVARQYCGVLGKQENCQVTVSVSLANDALSVPAAYRLYLPEAWTKDEKRRATAGVPREVKFKTKWLIAIEQIEQLAAGGVALAPVLADAGYGDTTEFRDRVTALHLPYSVGIKPETTVWPPGKQPLPPRPSKGRGRPAKWLRRTAEHRPMAVSKLAARLPKKEWQEVRWREGTRGTMSSRFAAVRVRPAHRDQQRIEPRPIEWLLIEWPSDEKEPTKYWLSTLPENAIIEELVRLAKLRWRIERDYEELKDEIGLDHYEGRSWRGFHHHGTLCIAAYAFLSAERARLSPPEPLAFLQAAPVPQGFRPRGAPLAN